MGKYFRISDTSIKLGTTTGPPASNKHKGTSKNMKENKSWDISFIDFSLIFWRKKWLRHMDWWLWLCNIFYICNIFNIRRNVIFCRIIFCKKWPRHIDWWLGRSWWHLLELHFSSREPPLIFERHTAWTKIYTQIQRHTAWTKIYTQIQHSHSMDKYLSPKYSIHIDLEELEPPLIFERHTAWTKILNPNTT